MRSFIWWCQAVDRLKSETRSSSLHNFEMAYCMSVKYLVRKKFKIEVKDYHGLHVAIGFNKVIHLSQLRLTMT